MKFLDPVVPEKIARSRLHRRRFGRVGSLIRSSARLWRHHGVGKAQVVRPESGQRRLPYLEVLWLPSYRVQLEVVRGDTAVTIETLVGGNERTFAVCDFSESPWRDSVGRDHFSATINEQEARAIATQGLCESLLRRRGWGRKFTIRPTVSTELVQYPYWVYYFARRGDKLDFRMLDALTGKPVGAKMKVSLLSALRNKDR